MARRGQPGPPFLNSKKTMGEATRKKRLLGNLYGNPFTGKDKQHKPGTQAFNDLDRRVVNTVRRAKLQGRYIVLVGHSIKSQTLVDFIGFEWLHKLQQDKAVIPRAIAWDPYIAAEGGPLIPSAHMKGGAIVVFGSGVKEWLDNDLDFAPDLRYKVCQAQMRTMCEFENGYI
jgi:hypothetical protein